PRPLTGLLPPARRQSDADFPADHRLRPGPCVPRPHRPCRSPFNLGGHLMADIPARTELTVTTGPIRGSRKIYVGPNRVAMRQVELQTSSGAQPGDVHDT